MWSPLFTGAPEGGPGLWANPCRVSPSRPMSVSVTASPSCTAGQPATCVLPALYLSPTRFSLLHRWPAGYRCVAGSLPLSDALLPLALLASQLQVRCQLSASLTRFSLLHRWPAGYRCVASSLPLCNVLLPLSLLANRLQVRCPLSTSLRRASPSFTAGQPAIGALPAF